MQNLNPTYQKARKQNVKKIAISGAILIIAALMILTTALFCLSSVADANAADGLNTFLAIEVPENYQKIDYDSAVQVGTYDEYSFIFDSLDDLNNIVLYQAAYIGTGYDFTIFNPTNIHCIDSGIPNQDKYTYEITWLDNVGNAPERLLVTGGNVQSQTLVSRVTRYTSDNHVKLVLNLSQSGYGYYRGNRALGLAKYAGVSLPDEPEAPEGQHFVGWYYNEAFTQPYEEGDVITEDTDLFAKFEVNAYTVTYNVNGTTYSTSELQHGATAANVVPTGITTGKEFTGWFIDAACTQAYNFSTSTVTGDITLYGKIQTIMLTVTFYVGEEVYTTLEVHYGATLTGYANSDTAGAATAAAIMQVYNLAPEFNAEAVLTEDTDVQMTMDEGLLKWNSFGVWMAANWGWVAGAAGLLIVIIVGAVVLAKKR